MADFSQYFDQGADTASELSSADTTEVQSEVSEAPSMATDADPDIQADTGATPDSAAAPIENSGAEEAFTAIDPSTLAPELQSSYRQMQADYTRKTQLVAQMRREFEQHPVTQTVLQIQQLAQSDPAGLVTALQQQLTAAQQWAAGQGIAIPDANAPQDEVQELNPEYMTETERALYEHLTRQQQMVQQLEQRLKGYDPVIQQAQQEKGMAQVQAAFTHLETEAGIGRKLSDTERNEIANLAVQHGANTLDKLVTVARAWDYKNAEKRGRDAASRVVEQKRGIPAAGGVPAATAGSNNRPTARPGQSKIESLVEAAMAGKLS
jgi:hypothetical protein